MLVELTTVPDASLPVAKLKEHLRLGSGFADDDLQDGLLTGFLRAAMSAIEGRISKVLLERDFEWTLSAWRDDRRQEFPIAPVTVVAGLYLLTETGLETAADPATWRLIPDHHAPRLEARGMFLPPPPPNGFIKVDFTAGFGPAWEDLPADLAQAVMLLASHYNEFRHDTALDVGCMPFGVTALIERYRTFRLFGGSRS